VMAAWHLSAPRVNERSADYADLGGRREQAGVAAQVRTPQPSCTIRALERDLVIAHRRRKRAAKGSRAQKSDSTIAPLRDGTVCASKLCATTPANPTPLADARSMISYAGWFQEYDEESPAR